MKDVYNQLKAFLGVKRKSVLKQLEANLAKAAAREEGAQADRQASALMREAGLGKRYVPVDAGKIEAMIEGHARRVGAGPIGLLQPGDPDAERVMAVIDRMHAQALGLFAPEGGDVA